MSNMHINNPGVFVRKVIDQKEHLLLLMNNQDLLSGENNVTFVVDLGTAIGALSTLLNRAATLDTILASEHTPQSITSKIAQINETIDKIHETGDEKPFPVFLLKSLVRDTTALSKLVDKHGDEPSECEKSTKETTVRALKWIGAGAAAVGAGFGCAWLYKKYVKPAMPIVVVVGTGNEGGASDADTTVSA